MATRQDTIDAAIEAAAKGTPREGIEMLRPLIHRDETRDEALFALAYCYERAEDYCTAGYLYDWIVERHPDFNVAEKHRLRCRTAREERGLEENFFDSGHVNCPCGLFQHRAEYGACPYCGRATHEAQPLGGAETPARLPSEGGSIGSEEEDSASAKEIPQSFSRGTADRLRQLMESEPVKDVAQKARELGTEATEKVRRIAEKEEIRTAKVKVEDLGRKVLQGTVDWAKSEKVRARFDRVVEFLERFIAKLQRVIDKMKR